MKILIIIVLLTLINYSLSIEHCVNLRNYIRYFKHDYFNEGHGYLEPPLHFRTYSSSDVKCTSHGSIECNQRKSICCEGRFELVVWIDDIHSEKGEFEFKDFKFDVGDTTGPKAEGKYGKNVEIFEGRNWIISVQSFPISAKETNKTKRLKKH